MTKFLKNKFVLLALIFSIMCSLYYCSSKKIIKFSHNIPILEIKTLEITKEDVRLNFEYPARVSGFREIEIKPQISGTILKKLYHEGSLVKEGEILFQIDPKLYNANVKKAKAKLSSAQTNLLKARKAFNRSKILYLNKAISSQEKDSDIANYRNAQDDVKQAESDLRIAKINLSYTNIISPITGLSTKENLSEGNFINTSDIITKIVQNDLIYINFAFPENDFYKIQKLIDDHKITNTSLDKQKVLIKIGNEILPDKGIISFTDSVMDHDTASFASRVEISNNNNRLKSGQFVRVALDDIMLKGAITVPAKCIIQTANGPITYVVNLQNEIEVRPIVTEFSLSENSIISSGLEIGDKVVIEDLMKLKPLQKVKPINYTLNSK